MNQIAFSKSLEHNGDVEETRLFDLERDMKNKIQKAKLMASSLKPTPENQEMLAACSAGQLMFPEFSSEVDYNQQFWRTYLKNQLSYKLIKELRENIAEFHQLVKDIQGMQDDYMRLFKMRNRKKNRRLAVQIEKKFECPYDKCSKIYGSDVSLNLHIKLKHNGGNKTDRQKLAQQICLAQLNKTQPPEMRLNLPPGYLEVRQTQCRNTGKASSCKNLTALRDSETP